MTGRMAAYASGPRTRWIVIGVWVLIALALAPLQPKLQDAASNENEAFLAESAESTGPEGPGGPPVRGAGAR